MKKDLLNKILNSSISDEKRKMLERIANNIEDKVKFDGGLNGWEEPTPKSQNHSTTIENSGKVQDTLNNLLNRLDSKK